MNHLLYQAVHMLKETVSLLPILPETQAQLLSIDEDTISQKTFLQLILSDILATVGILVHIKKNITKLNADLSTIDKGMLMMGMHTLRVHLGQVPVVTGSPEVLQDVNVINQCAQRTAKIGTLLAKMRFDINEHELTTACLCAFVPSLLYRAYHLAYTTNTLAVVPDETASFEAISFFFSHVKTPLCYIELFHPQFFASPRTIVIRDAVALATAIHQQDDSVLDTRIQKIAEAHRVDGKTLREKILIAVQA